jgi:hypothetical protein
LLGPDTRQGLVIRRTRVIDPLTGRMVLRLRRELWPRPARVSCSPDRARASRGFVAVWRPGERRLGMKTLRLPERRSGSDSFAPLC